MTIFDSSIFRNFIFYYVVKQVRVDAFIKGFLNGTRIYRLRLNKISNIYSEIKYSKSGESESQGNKSATKSDSIAALEQQLGQAVASLKI